MARMTIYRRPRSYMRDIQEEMNRIIEDAFGDMGLTESREEGREMVWKPAVEVNEQDGNYQIKAELPGMNKDNIDIEIGEDSITIKAETKKEEEEKKENVYRSEIRYGKFMRTVPLPSEVDSSKAKAEFKDGLLTITVPKSEEESRKTKKLKVE